MRYLKAFTVGILAAFVSLAVPFAALALSPTVLGWVTGGSAGIGAVSVSITPVLMLAAVAFLAGFIWTVKRRRS